MLLIIALFLWPGLSMGGFIVGQAIYITNHDIKSTSNLGASDGMFRFGDNGTGAKDIQIKFTFQNKLLDRKTRYETFGLIKKFEAGEE